MPYTVGSVSIIIPSFNRADALEKTLESLYHQSLPRDRYDVVVVDDGSTDGSLDLLQAVRQHLPLDMLIVRQERHGPGAARNRGARMAKGDLLLFWDSDMVAEEGVLQAHIEIQTRLGPAVVAGARRVWEPACQSTFSKVMYLATPSADQFSGNKPSFQEAFSSNLSLPRHAFWSLHGFDEDLWAFEDIDLAYRAQGQGLRLVTAREAIGFHNHPTTLEQACRQQLHYQKHAAVFLRKHPELDGEIRHLKDKGPIKLGSDPPVLVARKAIRRTLARPLFLEPLKALVALLERQYPDPRILAFLYWKILASYQLRGYRQGLESIREH